MTVKNTTTTPARKKPGVTPPKLEVRRTWRDALYESSTWAGVASLIAVFSTSGIAAFTDPVALSQIASGVGLIALREVSARKE